ncbi:2Fe-2S iron-sulfur cluster-binding protein [Streptacidiphilus sp. ASG 303]|uniref:(2Fe-2S)-binding protein n=1 Tax=Streptacidiphilus sp. ASG 303 TaxID=2896847 RepID=UPI0035AF399F
MTDHPTPDGGQDTDAAQGYGTPAPGGPYDGAPPFGDAPFADAPYGDTPYGDTPYAAEEPGAEEHGGHGTPAYGTPVGGAERPCASYTLRVNGADRPVADAWIGESLLFVLRERLGLAGAKDGCEQGECGACSVQVDGQLVASCLVPAALAAGGDIQTVEGLVDDGVPSDVQRALAESGAVQCGYCVPGLAMAVHDLLQRNHRPSDVEAREALCGNLCRCTGYQGVLRAVRTVAGERAAAAAEPEHTAPASEAPAQADGGPAAPAPADPAPAAPAADAPDVPAAPLPDPGAEPPVYADVPHPGFEPAPGGPAAAPPPPAEVDPLFGPLDAVLEAAAAPQAGEPAPAAYGTYAPDPYGTGVYAEEPYAGAYHPDPYRQSHGADTAPVPDLYTPDGQAAYDPAHGLGPQYGAHPDHGTPPYGTPAPDGSLPRPPAGGTPTPQDDRA